MGENSNIEWCDHTFNPWWGCQKVPRDPACHNCYAEAFAKRTGHRVWGGGKPRRILSDANWAKPLAWNEKAKMDGVRRRVFCASMADVFEDRRDLDEHRDRLWQIIRSTPHLDWLLLTKRPENFGMLKINDDARHNVWLGVTAATQEHYDLRWPLLAKEEAAVRFISAEPIRGDLELLADIPRVPLPDWIIVGGESGAGARPTNVEFVMNLVAKCNTHGIPCFVKQLGSKAQLPSPYVPLRVRDAKGGDMSEWPPFLRVREFPEVP